MAQDGVMEQNLQRQTRNCVTERNPYPSVQNEEPEGLKAGPEQLARWRPHGRAIIQPKVKDPELLEPSLMAIRQTATSLSSWELTMWRNP
jgi:hypothetical protein